jgi:hypothetical protein
MSNSWRLRLAIANYKRADKDIPDFPQRCQLQYELLKPKGWMWSW